MANGNMIFSEQNLMDAGSGMSTALLWEIIGQIPVIGDLLNEWGPAAMQAGEQERATAASREEQEERYNQALREVLRLRDRVGPAIGDLGASLQSGLGELGETTRGEMGQLQNILSRDLVRNMQADIEELGELRDTTLAQMERDLAQNLGEYGEFADPLMQAVRDRETRLLGELEGAGDQERIDINQAYDVEGRNALADLSARGFGGSTIGSTIGIGNERERTDAVARLEERIRGERFDAGERLSADTLAMQEALGLGEFELGRSGREQLAAMAQLFGGTELDVSSTGRSNLLGMTDRFGTAGIDLGHATGQAQLGVEEQFGLMGLDFDTMNTNRLIDIILGRTDLPPSGSAFVSAMNQEGAAGASMPDQPSVGEQMGYQAAGIGAGVLGNALLPGFGAFFSMIPGLFGGGGNDSSGGDAVLPWATTPTQPPRQGYGSNTWGGNNAY